MICLYKQKKYEETKKMCEDFIKKIQNYIYKTRDYTFAEVFLIWGKSYERTFDFLKAYEVYKYSQKFLKNKKSLFTLEILYRKKTIKKYNLHNTKVTSLDDFLFISYIDDVTSFLLQQNLSEEALDELEVISYNIIRKNSNLLFKLAIIYNNLAEKISHYNEPKDEKSSLYKRKADEIFREIIVSFPNTVYAKDSQYYLGYIYSDNITTWNNDYKKALQEYENFLHNHSNSILSLAVVENIYFCYKNLNLNPDEITEKLTGMFKQYEGSLLVSLATKYYIGVCLYEKNNYKDAIKYFFSVLSDSKKLNLSEYNLMTSLTYLIDKHKEITSKAKIMWKKCKKNIYEN